MVLLYNGNEISRVRSYMGTYHFGYEPVWLTKSPDFGEFIMGPTS